MVKTIKYDLPVIASFAPDIVILQLGTNDLSQLVPLVVGSSIEELVTTLHDRYNIKIVCACQTLRGSDPVFNARVHALNKYLKTLLEALPYSFFWGHWGFWNSSQGFLARDGVHLNRQGQFKFFRSLRGAVFFAHLFGYRHLIPVCGYRLHFSFCLSLRATQSHFLRICE